MINILSPRKSLNKAFLKVKPNRSEIEKFKTNLKKVLQHINDQESEEHHKNLVIEFLKDTYYSPSFYTNTKGRSDLVIHNGKDAKSTVGVLIEAKKPGNKGEMLKKDNLNSKAFQELLLYYLRERISEKNLEIKNIVATNIYEWFIFDAHLFEKLFASDKKLVKQFEDFEAGRLAGKDTSFFYKEVAESAIASVKDSISFTYFNLKDYEKPLNNEDKQDDKELIALYKLLSPEHLLKLPFANDSNSLDKAFYAELLHIIGLTETKEGGKKLIQRKKKEERNNASLLENAIIVLESRDKISRLERPGQYGETEEERLFAVGLELVITWINRILFLKLLEAQLVAYHKGDKEYNFLNRDKIKSFDDLESLFFQVLAKKTSERNVDLGKLFSNVPYLNSSLFEPTEMEHQTICISNLSDDKKLPLLPGSILKNSTEYKNTKELNALEYLFEFLNAYDFSSEGSEEIQEENKTLINASVLGLIFEKINGYKDGSFFTPGFITMYMCKETIRRAVVQKFNEKKGWELKEYDELYDKIEDRKEANEIINSLKICDPAVGSGHFLVSALNEIIAIKADLKVLCDREGKRLKEYQVEVVNDELVVTDEDDQLVDYNPKNKESQRIQETLFHEKQTIIENCLFGVDINPNSVKICRLRLWIELLKNAYYKADSKYTELETLPNIDINIKIGNSLISRFALDTDLKEALKKSKSKWNIEGYKMAVHQYQHAQSKEEKREMERLINEIKSNFHTEISDKDPKKLKLNKLKGELYNLTSQIAIFGMSEKEKKKFEKDVETKSKELNKLEAEIEEIKNNKIYENAFEWRFEFPEVLNEQGDFVGFDAVIGNPPYFSLSKSKEYGKFFETSSYTTYSKGTDIYCLFYELGNNVLNTGGYLTFITSNSWLRAIYGDLLKEFFYKNTQPISLLNIEDVQVFDEATVETNIITLQKKAFANAFKVCNVRSDYVFGNSFSDYFVNNHFDFILTNIVDWAINGEETFQLKKKIENGSKLLKQFSITINFGIKTGFNGAFIIDQSIKNKLIKEDIKSEQIIKPILRGRDLKKYSYEFLDFYMICAFPSLKIDIENYSAIKSYLESFGKKKLEQSGNPGSRKKTNNEWFETQDSISYWQDFEKPKIIWGEISDKPKFAYDDQKFYAEATTFLMTGEKLKYLLAILNSKVSEWYFNQISTTTGMGTNRWKKYKIELLPIKEPAKEEELKVEKLVDEIITLKRSDSNSDTTSIEKEIDQLVYQLYELTPEEIQIIESNT